MSFPPPVMALVSDPSQRRLAGSGLNRASVACCSVGEKPLVQDSGCPAAAPVTGRDSTARQLSQPVKPCQSAVTLPGTASYDTETPVYV